MYDQIKKLLIPENATALNALQVINEGANQIALVVDGQGKLKGTLSDGDIRRWILKGHNLEANASEIMNKDFRFIRCSDRRELAWKIMEDELLSQIPIIDIEGRPVDLVLFQDRSRVDNIPNAAFILAGGEGKRLRPYTESCPKPMLIINDKPILEILIERLRHAGIRRFYLSVNYLKEQITGHFGDGTEWGVEIVYIEEELPLGTAGSLSMLPSSESHPVLVANGDILSNFQPANLLRYHDSSKAAMTLCTRDYDLEIPYGVIESDERLNLKEIKEKPVVRFLVNAGIYVIRPDCLRLLPPEQQVDMPDFIRILQSAGQKVALYPLHEYWADIGFPESLNNATLEWPTINS